MCHESEVVLVFPLVIPNRAQVDAASSGRPAAPVARQTCLCACGSASKPHVVKWGFLRG